MLTFNNKIITHNTKWIGDTYTPPEPVELPPFTLRVKFKTGHNPIPSNTKFDVLTQISVEPNIWDLTRYDPDWRSVLASNLYLLEVLGANTTGVTNMRDMFAYYSYVGDFSSVVLFDTSSVTSMHGMFYGCTKLTTVPLYDTSNVTDMANMFTDCYRLISVPLFNTSNVTSMAVMLADCRALTSIPLFDTSKVQNMDTMCRDCYNVQSGALALYQQASTQSNPPSSHDRTFEDCGRDTTTGAAELAQIPTSWGGTLST